MLQITIFTFFWPKKVILGVYLEIHGTHGPQTIFQSSFLPLSENNHSNTHTKYQK